MSPQTERGARARCNLAWRGRKGPCCLQLLVERACCSCVLVGREVERDREREGGGTPCARCCIVRVRVFVLETFQSRNTHTRAPKRAAASGDRGMLCFR